MNENWRQDPRLKGMDEKKLKYLTELADKAGKTPKDKLMPLLMSMASLHIEWQQKLIAMIRELNPNVQIILTTHSPAVIMEGWLDAVTEVSDISTEADGFKVSPVH